MSMWSKWILYSVYVHANCTRQLIKEWKFMVNMAVITLWLTLYWLKQEQTSPSWINSLLDCKFVNIFFLINLATVFFDTCIWKTFARVRRDNFTATVLISFCLQLIVPLPAVDHSEVFFVVALVNKCNQYLICFFFCYFHSHSYSPSYSSIFF